MPETHDTFYHEFVDEKGRPSKVVSKVVNGSMTPQQFHRFLQKHNFHKGHSDVKVHPVKKKVDDKNHSIAELLNMGPPQIQEAEPPTVISIGSAIHPHEISNRLVAPEDLAPPDELVPDPILGPGRPQPANKTPEESPTLGNPAAEESTPAPTLSNDTSATPAPAPAPTIEQPKPQT